MEQINRVELAGRVGTVRVNKVGERSVCNFSVATSFLYKSQDGTPSEEVCWHNCVLWTGRKYPSTDFIRVGLPVHLTGRLKMAKYTGSDGVDRNSFEVMVADIETLAEDAFRQSGSV